MESPTFAALIEGCHDAGGRPGSLPLAHRNVHYIWEETTPVSMNPELSRPAFRVELRPETNEEYMHRGQLYISVVLSRLLAPQLIEAYIPSAFLVVVSWLIFWLDAATERVAVCVTILLALYSQSTGARQLLPPSTSMTALDHWMVVCVLFVFAALAQTAQGMWTKRPLLEPARTPVNKAAWIWAWTKVCPGVHTLGVDEFGPMVYTIVPHVDCLKATGRVTFFIGTTKE
ncbi:hypothetical protein HPB49_003353 [Dermacentor silvarum]|uniref:Uncharacterized protein n=1 Tax=Dermacentor silvarum TaxID=543639 RepID=A0ACB8DTU7_DERSI|nr:hypothetical protein HPB49_003353 [Dermacentor silvarum]